jgi:hypothetical protein
MPDIDRRTFLCAMSAGALSYALRGTSGERVRLYFNGVGSSTALRRGVIMATEEAMRAAAMFGGDVGVRDPAAGDDIMPPYALSVWVVGAGVGPRRDDLIDLTRRSNALVFNTDDTTDELRAGCEPGLFHIAPSGSARRDAAVWIPALKRFGADSLNKRFEARWGERMTAPAWAGWFAVKCAFEATLQSRASTAREVIAWLERPTTRFDGHKGVALSFNARHELVQPLYYMNGDEVQETEPMPNSSTASCR